MIQTAKKEVLGHFQEFGLLNRLDIAYCDRTQCFPAFGNFELLKTNFWMIQRAKIEVFGPLLEFGLLYGLDIAYCDRI